MRRYRGRFRSRIRDSIAFNIFKSQCAGPTRCGAGEYGDRISDPRWSFRPLGATAYSLRGKTETQVRHSPNHGVCSVEYPKAAAAQTRFAIRCEEDKVLTRWMPL